MNTPGRQDSVLDRLLLLKEKASLQKQSVMLREAERRDGSQSRAWVSGCFHIQVLDLGEDWRSFSPDLGELLPVPLTKNQRSVFVCSSFPQTEMRLLLGCSYFFRLTLWFKKNKMCLHTFRKIFRRLREPVSEYKSTIRLIRTTS